MALLSPEITQEIMETKAFSVVPRGMYLLQVTKADVAQTKSKTGLMVKVEFDILGPAYQGRKLFANFNIRNASSIAEQIGKQQLKSLLTAGHVQEPFRDTDQLLGAVVLGNVQIDKGDDQYDESNVIKSFKEAEQTHFGEGAEQAGDAAKLHAKEDTKFSQAFSAPSANAVSGGWPASWGAGK